MNITPITKKMSISVPAKGQPVKFIYNKVADIIKEEHVSATIRTGEPGSIQLSPATSDETKRLIDRLNSLGAKYTAQ